MDSKGYYNHGELLSCLESTYNMILCFNMCVSFISHSHKFIVTIPVKKPDGKGFVKTG